MLLDEIPGLKEARTAALAREETLREIPFLPANLDICGVEVRQFTPRHFILLNAAGSPFLGAGEIAIEHVAQFLWVISPQFCTDPFARDLFLANVQLSFETDDDDKLATLIAAIDRYLEDALIDRPSGAGSETPLTHFAAAIVDEIASEYGWDDEVILEKPFARLFQYLRRIERRRDPRTPRFNRLSDGAERAAVKAWLKGRESEANSSEAPQE